MQTPGVGELKVEDWQAVLGEEEPVLLWVLWVPLYAKRGVSNSLDSASLPIRAGVARAVARCACVGNRRARRANRSRRRRDGRDRSISARRGVSVAVTGPIKRFEALAGVLSRFHAAPGAWRARAKNGQEDDEEREECSKLGARCANKNFKSAA